MICRGNKLSYLAYLLVSLVQVGKILNDFLYLYRGEEKPFLFKNNTQLLSICRKSFHVILERCATPVSKESKKNIACFSLQNVFCSN